METAAIKITYEDYLLLNDAEKRCELIDGGLYMVPGRELGHKTKGIYGTVEAFQSPGFPGLTVYPKGIF